MRRTYRSKKDAGGALDPRDVVLNLDEKSSAFDAFYIQNIKQTKRELSCVASSNLNKLASNKVRKRKYVKRIVKEVEPVRQRETMSTSTYLTPDKSIRVNKVLDPFDMLLNSTPAGQEQPNTVKDDSFDRLLPKRECKTYKRRTVRKVKQYNYSSSDSYSTESDKENTSQSQSNVTDIGAHQLIIEKEPIARNSPYLDESINKIVNNISLFNNLKHQVSNGAVNAASYKNIKRLTRISCQNSPILQKSPLCSTPFKEKYRGVSIFKFSPIPQKEQGISPNLITMQEKDESISTDSIVYVGNDNSKLIQNNQTSPVADLPDEIIKNKIEMSLYENEAVEENKDYNQNVKEIAVIGDEIRNISQSLSCVKNPFQITHEEPFLGFSKHDDDIVTPKMNILECLEENKSIQNESNLIENDLEIRNIDMNDSNNASSISEPSDQANTSHSSDDADIFERESLYDTCNSEQSSSLNESRDNREPIVAIEKLSDSLFMKYYKQMQIDSQDDNAKTDDEYESLSNDSREELETNMSTIESNSLETKLNAIVITDSSTTEDMVSDDMTLDRESESYDEAEANNEDDKYISFVTTRRRYDILKDSMYILDNSCCSSSTDCDKTVLSNVNNNLEKSELNISKVNTTNNLDNLETKDVVEDSKLSKSPEKTLSNETISRRSNSPLKHSNSIRLDISNVADRQSVKRVSRKSLRKYMKSLNQKDSSNTESDSTEIDIEPNMNENNESIIDNSEQKIDFNIQKNDESSRLTTYDLRQNTHMNNHERLSCTGPESKSCIVLQPGKKWERSLSIYRRMSMVTDHFDETILEDECRINKGRKYRQSVIHTMEMQELRDSLHNDSINIRRSTFVSKPSRPTIRFVIDNNISRVSLSTSSVFDDLKGFLNEECDDTVIELSKLSIADSEHEVTILDNFHESERVTTAQDYVLRRCNQAEPVLFDECYPETVLKNCRKIGEGVYGEVFLWRGRDGRARVMKIVPIAGTLKVNGEDQKDFHEIISEIVIAMELSALRAPIADIERQLDEGNDIHALELHAIENATDVFNEVLAVRCVFGPYPSRLLDLWDLYDECKGSDNDNPAVLPSDQQYIVLELANAGQDLESFQFTGAQQAHTLFQQLALGLAVAEEAFQFEHRDLHWGNVLIAPTEQKLATFVLRGRTYRVPRGGVAATIIDYSLSRLTLPLQADSAALYNDLATDEQLFDAVGDYQFEVYRLMRDKVGNDWKNFEPYTNILWLHYTVDKMITALRYKRTNTKIHKHYIEKLKGIKDRILEYGSSVQYVLTDIEF